MSSSRNHSKSRAPRLPFMRFWVDDWITSDAVESFTLAQQGAYLRLLLRQFKSPDGVLPRSEAQLARLSGLGDDWPTLGRPIIERCFVKHGTGFANPRCRDEWERARDRWIQTVKAGRKRWK